MRVGAIENLATNELYVLVLRTETVQVLRESKLAKTSVGILAVLRQIVAHRQTMDLQEIVERNQIYLRVDREVCAQVLQILPAADRENLFHHSDYQLITLTAFVLITSFLAHLELKNQAQDPWLRKTYHLVLEVVVVAEAAVEITGSKNRFHPQPLSLRRVQRGLRFLGILVGKMMRLHRIHKRLRSLQ